MRFKSTRDYSFLFYLPIAVCNFSYSSFIPKDACFLLVFFPLVQKTSLRMSYRTCVLVMNFLVLLYLRRSLFILLLKTEFQIDRPLPQQWKDVVPSSSASAASVEKHRIFSVSVHLYIMYCLSLTTFRIFFLIFGFQQLDFDASRCGFLGFYVFSVSLSLNLCIYVFHLFWEVSGHYFFRSLFCLNVFFLRFQNSNYTYVRSFDFVPEDPKTLLTFSIFYSFSLDNFC